MHRRAPDRGTDRGKSAADLDCPNGGGGIHPIWVMATLDRLRVEAGFSKAELARRIGKDPAAIRRLFTVEVNGAPRRRVE